MKHSQHIFLMLAFMVCVILVSAPVSADITNRSAYLPVTFTQQGWHDFCDPNNGIIPGGMIYNRFPLAFSNFRYFGVYFPNKLILGTNGNTITYVGKTSSLTRLCLLLPQYGPDCGALDRHYESPWAGTSGGWLAGETLALMLNIAYNDMRLMPRSRGYDLEEFIIADGPLRYKKVGDALNAANALLGGHAAPCWFGLVSCQQLAHTLSLINANYEFVDYNTYINRGFLIPNRPLGLPDPPHPPAIPYKAAT